MIELSERILQEIREHAARDYPRESCGIVVVVKGKHRYIPCRNIAESDGQFIIHPEDFARAEDTGTLAMIVHSHPNIPPIPSQADMVMCETHGLPWLIVNWPTGAIHQFAPSGWKAPLIGRHYSYGVLDCMALVRDYYAQELKIEMPNPHREDKWWEKGQNLYLDNAEEWGFVQVYEKQKHDVLLMQYGSTVPNHLAVWLGDGTILHHQMGRLSSRDVFGGWYEKICTHVFRHKDLL